MGSFSLSGGVEVIGFISPTDPLDEYPVIDPLYGIDGFRNVDLLSDLNNIPELRRRAGMVVGVSGGTQYYITPVTDNTINLGTPIKRFRDINTVSGTTTVWTSTIKVYTPELDLGLDSLGNQRTITANNSVIQNDILNGGIF